MSAAVAVVDIAGWIRLSAATSFDQGSSERAVRLAADRDRDLGLIERAKKGDRRASTELFRRYADDVHRRLTRMIGPDPEREDLVQEVFMSAFRGLERFRGDAAFSTWLYRVIVHVAYGHLRKRRRRPLDVDAAIELLPMDPDASPEASAQRREETRRALALLERLKPKKRIAFVLREIEGLSLPEIAVIVESTPAAVGQRVKHAQRELAVMIERESKRKEKGR